MDLQELDEYLKCLNPFEQKVMRFNNNYAVKDKDNKLKLFYGNGIENNQWTIKSNKFLKEDEMIGLHKHDRFIPFDKHKHDFLEMIYVYSGSIKQCIGGKEVTIKTGEIVLMDLNVHHSIEPADRDDIAVNILIKKEFFDRIVMSQLADNDIISDFVVKAFYDKKSYKSFLHFHTADNDRIQTLVKNLFCEIYDTSFGSATATRSYMMLIFTELLRMHKRSMSKVSKAQLNSAIESEITCYLLKEYRDISIKKLAKHFNFNPDYLGKIVKQTTGKNFTDLLQEIRLNEACLLLKKSDYSISDIIKEIGYSNKTYFYKLFKKYYGITPDEYRRKHLRGQSDDR